ncbi:MAG TPA: DUF1887 family CARF protein [Ktedonobacteraceae bacterium]|nr:DUF1887 family CARF protein [Ktedonobacteraceae bacterium]
MTLMIALVGEQPMPNLLPVRHSHPSDVLLVYTKRTKGIYDRLAATLQKEANVYELETEPYRIGVIVDALKAKLESPELAGKSNTFNLTGGTKAMAFAAYQVAQQQKAPMFYLQSEGKHNRIYHYIWEDRGLKLVDDELVPACVKLNDLFNLHFGPGEWQECSSNRGDDGGPFEVALAEALRLNEYEVMTGVRAMDGQIDIDVAMRFENRFGIIEAKAGNKGKKLDGIKQLSNAVRHIGTYTQSFFAITVQHTSTHEAIMLASRIKVVSLTNYVPGSETLTLDDAKKLVGAVDEVLK